MMKQQQLCPESKSLAPGNPRSVLMHSVNSSSAKDQTVLPSFLPLIKSSSCLICIALRNKSQSLDYTQQQDTLEHSSFKNTIYINQHLQIHGPIHRIVMIVINPSGTALKAHGNFIIAHQQTTYAVQLLTHCVVVDDDDLNFNNKNNP